MNLRSRILVLVIGLLLLVMSGISIPLYWYTRSAMEEQLDQYLVSTIDLIALQLDDELISILIAEPGLSGIRQKVESQLSNAVVGNIVDIALFNQNGNLVAEAGQQQFRHTVGRADLDINQKYISRIQFSQADGYYKSAETKLLLDNGAVVQIAIWGGVGFVSVVEQLLGSLFWITLLSLLAGIALAVIFSRSLVRPVRELSEYTGEIRRNLYSDPVNLGRQDEIGALNSALIEMHDEIRSNERRNKELLAGIAHEIKNPLGGIEIYTGLLEAELVNDEHKEYLGKISSELQNLKRVVLEYLDYARPPKSRIGYQKIETIVNDAARLLKPELDSKNVNLTINGSAAVAGDESKLRRVMVNLVKNSLEAVAAGGRIEISIVGKPPAVEISVSDNGEGIPAENIDRIFNPHFSTRDSGYGLGLAIAKNIIDEMNGTVIVKSAPGQGTDFIISLPGK